MKVLITGANGFLGSHLVETSLSLGNDTFALIRQGANTKNLQHVNGHTTVAINYDNETTIRAVIANLGSFDQIIHCAGLTHAFTYEPYEQANVVLTQSLLNVIKNDDLLNSNGVFILISTMAAMGPVGANGPISNYGKSKKQTELIVQKSELPFLIFRPTGIYGRHDRQFLSLFKAVDKGLYPNVTSPNQKITLINAADVARNVLTLKVKNQTIHLDDGQVYTHPIMRKTLEEIFQRKTRLISIPRPIVLASLVLSDFFTKLFRLPIGVTREQYREISRDWNHDFSPERKLYPLTIKFDLKKGFSDTLDFYKSQNLI